MYDYHGYRKIKSAIVMIDNMTKLPNNQIINDNSNDLLEGLHAFSEESIQNK